MSSARRARRTTHGCTLLELLLALAMTCILASVAIWGGKALARGWQLKRAGHQLLEDLKALQSRAEMSGSLTMCNGSLVMQRTFLVFDATTQSYEAFAWLDENGNSSTDTGESSSLWRKGLPPGVAFGWAPSVDHRACSNAAGPPGEAISFASPASQPCDNRPCIKFDQHGFSTMGPGAIYLNEGEQSLAITATRPGHFTMCEWSGERWH